MEFLAENQTNNANPRYFEASLFIHRIGEIAENLENRLIRYAQRADANQKSIDLQKQLIDELYEIYDVLKELEPIDVWVILLWYFELYKEKEKDYFVVKIPVRKNPKEGKFIEIDLTKAQGVRDE